MKTRRPLIVLSIDDEAGCQLAVSRFMSRIGGHTVEVAADGREGLRKAAAIRPDVILLDLSMPDMNGLDVLIALASTPETRTIPVIIVSGMEATEEQRDLMKRCKNFVFMVQKPASLNDLMMKVETLAGQGIAMSGTSYPTVTDYPDPA